MSLTQRQKEVLNFIEHFIHEREIAPSYEEIREHFKFKSLNSVFKHLKQLENRGYINSPWGNRKRALNLVEHGRPSIAIPLLGMVAAGEPIEAIEVSEQVDIPESLLRGGECFALKVKGDSMIENGIHDGDIILVMKQETAENGETVVALIGEEATVKKFYQKGKIVELRPANPAMEPIVVDTNLVNIRGIVIGLLRRY